MTNLLLEYIEVPGVRVGAENPLPIFREKKANIEVPLRETVDAEKRRYFGNASGKRVLPYRMQDDYTRLRKPYSMQVAVLENKFLKATFWIELGCRMMSLIYKPLQRELLFNNPVFQPANLALRNAWFAGGVEWNVGQLGHTFFTCSPLFVARIHGLNGEPGLRIYEYERCKNLFWHTDFYLPEDSEFLIAFTRVINSQDEDTTLYWWTNIAVPETSDTRVLAPTSEAIYIDRAIKGFGQAELPFLPTYSGEDATYPIHSPHANEFFFQCQEAELPWEAALDRNGEGLIEASTPRLCVRKMFCWGMHQGGRHWQEFLSVPGMAYTEIQAGLAPTQRHSLPFEAGGNRHWTEVFGYIQADPTRVHSPDWQEAWRCVDSTLKSRISSNDLAGIEGKCLLHADHPPVELLQTGSGWGALELARRSAQKDGIELPPTFVFPPSTLGGEQRKWLSLLEDGKLPEQPPDQIPGDWMIQSQWRELLRKSLEKEENQNWYALLHYGVMLAEVFDEPGAITAWEESIARTPSLWAYRNLAVVALASGKVEEALDTYHKAWELAISTQPHQAGFAQEYLSLLVEAGEFPKAWEVYQSLAPEVKDTDAIQILRARIALQVGRLDEAEPALHREYASIREGAVILTDLWIDLWRQRIAAETGRSPDEIGRQEIETAHPAPAGIDFRSAQ